MKKTLVSALTTALVVGAASTTFAAANPFEDVPADHWAYDAIAQLAADGVIEGYGDGTYRGDQEITRYEMAQMIARAMAKGGGDKALIDKLAAEFADELNNLGVRVAALEKKVDNVKWGGRIRYSDIHKNQAGSQTNTRKIEDGKTQVDDRVNVNEIRLRLEPQMKINEHWTGKARIDYYHKNNMDDAANETTGKNGNGGVTLDRMWVQGDYKNLQIHLGKLTYATKADYGLIMNRYISGGSVIFGSDIKVALSLGRVNANDNKLEADYTYQANSPGNGLVSGDTASYGAIEIYNDRSKRFTWGLGYHQFRNLTNASVNVWNDTTKKPENHLISEDDNYGIFNLGLGYKFTPDLKLTGAWSRALSLDAVDGVDFTSSAKNSYAVQLEYKGAVPTKVNSWGAYIAWRQIGQAASTGWTQYSLTGPQYTGSRGFEIGASWTPMKNVVGCVKWFTGKDLKAFEGNGIGDYLADREKVNTIFTEWSFIF